MNKFKKLVCLAVALVLAIQSGFYVFAAADTIRRPVITVDTVKAAPGDTVYIKVAISKNEAMQAMAFSITYDNTALQFQEYVRGDLTDYMAVDNGDRVNFVDCESKNFKIDVLIGTFVFKVKEDAEGGFYELRIANRQPYKYGEDLTGAFANGYKDTIIPTVVNGGVNVPVTEGNCRHIFGKWNTVMEPSCDKEGISVRVCGKCGRNEEKPIETLSHDFEERWTVDREATKDVPGVMSRHCKNCDAKTDVKTFEYEMAQENDFNNKVDSPVDNKTVNKNEDKISDSDIVIEEKPKKTTEDIDVDAQKLIELKKDENNPGIFAGIYMYLFGDGEDKGIIGVIITALKEFLNK